MRFLADGPSIPDELLVARDEGRVVFFCGAGVSRARARLVDFLGLARVVADKLAIGSDSATRKLINTIETFPPIAGVGNLISADRVFSLIEREFISRDIYRAIASALKPSDSTDLSAHRDILDLARGPDGTVRLITTNFDLLFEACDNTVRRWRPPRLPDPLRSDEFGGVIHLHGHVTDDYTDAAGDGFVISSAEFGQAYLSERWAVDFIRTVLEKFLVVFIGYAADDPPMQYLLEALNRSAGSLSGVYAFQSGSIEDAEVRWLQRGVRPIAYGSSADHAPLWSTLSTWAARARDPEQWYNQTITLARSGPEALAPHERGQVAHITSTLEGARRFAQTNITPPASWLCTFDPFIRFSNPGRLGSSAERGDYFDPFDAYGLDSDPVPRKLDPDDNFVSRETPRDVWNCFALARQDRENLEEDQYPGLRGHWSMNAPRLPRRLDLMGVWLAKVASQPAAVWWAANQVGLHPDIQQQIRYAVEREPANFSNVVRKAWRIIFDAWDNQRGEFYKDWFPLVAHVKADGWSAAAIRELCAIQRPYQKVRRALGSAVRAPENKADIRLGDLIYIDIEYPSHNEEISIPDEHLPLFLKESRKNLELGVALENEIGGYGLHHLSPIEADTTVEGEKPHLSGISKPLLAFVGFFRKLATSNPKLARAEALGWQFNQDAVFIKLKIWACADRRLFTPSEAARIFRKLKQSEFWNSINQRDLLFALAKRWNGFPVGAKRGLEQRLLRGRSRWKGEKRKDFVERRAFQTLSRVHWLDSQGCKFTFDLDERTKALKVDSPQWDLKAAEHAAASLVGRSGWVRTDTDSSGLTNEPLANILTKARELSGRTQEFFVEKDPFAGFVAKKPIRAFVSLVLFAKRGSYPDWAWRTFLNSDARKTDKPRLVVAIAVRLSRFLNPKSSDLVRPVSDWLQKVSGILLSTRRDAFEQLWAALIAVLRTQVDAGASSVVRQREEPDWATEALNSSIGSMAQALMEDPELKDLKSGTGFPTWWTTHAEELLLLPDKLRRYALPLFTHNLVWLFSIDPRWTKQHFLPIPERCDEDSSAFWAGFFWGAKIPQRDLYLLLKPALLRLATEKSIERRQHTEILAGVILAGWGSKRSAVEERMITDDELRSLLIAADDEFRTQVVWLLERWAEEEDSHWSTDALVLLRDVWPRQIVAKTPRVSARLCEFAFSQGEKFPHYVDAILPLVTRIVGDEVNLPILRQARDNIVDRFPERALALLSEVLPDNVRQWPYGIEDVLTRIGNADSALHIDARLIELNRKWNAR